ncbi:hypothetical protein ABT160_45735, partial [Streptomyces sp. NPDC001941]
LEGSFYRGMRLAAVDGFLLDVPDNEANRLAFGGPKDSSGKPGGFPQVRVVTLTETGTHVSAYSCECSTKYGDTCTSREALSQPRHPAGMAVAGR